MEIELTLQQTLIIALGILLLGYFLNSRVVFLKNNNIPEPVVGGLIFSLFSALAYSNYNTTLNFDMTLKSPLMTLFFTTVGLGASFKLLKLGGPKVILFLAVATGYLFIQNIVGISIAHFAGIDYLYGLIGGSVTLSGGHGNAATYADLFINHYDADSSIFELAMAAATFGLILGGLIGGPVTKRLVIKHNLTPQNNNQDINAAPHFNPTEKDIVTPKKMMETLLVILICMLVGQQLHTMLLHSGIILPAFLIPLLIGVALTNASELHPKLKLSRTCIDLWGTMALSIFLAMALMSLRIWELLNLAAPLIIMILMQCVVLMLFTYFVTFKVMGNNYDSAIMAGGHCGFGLGATPTAVANMEISVTKYGPSAQAFLTVPLVGAFFIDITNALVIQLFLTFY
ncbi:sodium/glutamate symporter [Pseudoalteromonas tetraodonis]|uniref:sodium/glutamate symporter n=1 Tax=Pseudoalteromonas tetraodonis TaxID=43659 RepID=UPI001BDF563D|nr:sodium/glutamate symporter [Pseudoalteromonas tetraodonis]MBT2153237.1 sodium/glutamate symporter [Pseudoalteromonas tetraodonis]